MQHAAGRRLLLGMIALGGLVLALISTSALALGESRGAAWCHDGNRWLAYAEGIPGSATPEDFTTCLRQSAARGDVMAFDGQLVEGGALIDVGDSSLFWTLPDLLSLELKVTAYRDHVLFGDNCDRVFEVRSGTVQMIAPGYPCLAEDRIREDARTLTEVDFTVFVADGQFVVEGSDGWYHINGQPVSGRPGPAPLGEIVLKGANGAIWVVAEIDVVKGVHYDLHQPVANTAQDAQQFRAYDWESRVRGDLIPLSFDRSAYYLLPDFDAYWNEVRGWLDAIMDDLFHGREAPISLEVLRGVGWRAYAFERTIFISQASAFVIIHELAHILSGSESAHGGRFTATLLMLWERYVPGFDTARALELTQRYAVDVGHPVEVEPVSDRTQIVRQLLAKEAPVLPSDDTPIEADEMLLRVVLEVGTMYDRASNKLVVTPQTAPKCIVDRINHPPRTEFSINAGGEWNGLSLTGIHNISDDSDYGVFVDGTPTVAGRVRVKVTTKCPGGSDQEPRLVGWSEVIVRDPQSSN